jgi:hypothetical protein
MPSDSLVQNMIGQRCHGIATCVMARHPIVAAASTGTGTGTT